MATFLHTMRLVVGLALLAGGAALTQPLCAAVFSGQRPDPAAAPAQVAVVWQDVGPRGGHSIVDVRASAMPATPEAPPAGNEAERRAARGHACESPAPLPVRSPDGLAPDLDAAYRSTVEIPPPPLLDVHAPPPLAVGWGAHDVVRPTVSPDRPAPAAPTTNSYVVRDGDDLTGIAMSVYGHAGAAEAIWNANRDRLSDPRLLPIGIALRLPPSWMLPAARAAAGTGSIEPRVVGRNGAEVPDNAAHAAPPPRPDGHWLGEASSSRPTAMHAGGNATPAGVAGAGQLAQTGSRPGTVRVGPGESLDTIALRLYGDRGMAKRIWAVNQDRLRSPELLVPGTELRLP